MDRPLSVLSDVGRPLLVLVCLEMPLSVERDVEWQPRIICEVRKGIKSGTCVWKSHQV